MTIDPIELLLEFYDAGSQTFKLLLDHGRAVAAKALRIVDALPSDPAIDRELVSTAALLHDIGILFTHAPEIGCTGEHPYICHGFLGRELLDKKGLFRHALICERHVGVGIKLEEIQRLQLPLPNRDMRPVSIEEEIICYADKFFSKSPTKNDTEKTVTKILTDLAPYGQDKIDQFLLWVNRFGNPV